MKFFKGSALFLIGSIKEVTFLGPIERCFFANHKLMYEVHFGIEGLDYWWNVCGFYAIYCDVKDSVRCWYPLDCDIWLNAAFEVSNAALSSSKDSLITLDRNENFKGG